MQWLTKLRTPKLFIKPFITIMMTNSISLRTSNSNAVSFNAAPSALGKASKSAPEALDIIDFVANLKPIRVLAEMYSGLMEENITPRFTLHLLNVQAAAFMVIMPVDLPVFTHILCLLWFVMSICLAKHAYCKQ